MRISDQIILSDRLSWSDDLNGELNLSHMHVENSCYRFIPFFIQPGSYTEENQNTIACFKKYLLDRVGYERFNTICQDVNVDLDEMYHKGLSLSEREVSKILISSRQITRDTLFGAIQGVHQIEMWTLHMPALLKAKLLQVQTPEELDCQTLHELYLYLEKPFGDELEFVSSDETTIAWALAKLVYILSRIVFSNYLFIKERVLLADSNSNLNQMGFYERMAMCFAKQEDMKVGTLLRAPNNPQGDPVYYRLAAKLISANGQVCMFFIPANEASNLPPLRVTRGTSFTLSGIDALSYFITDFEEEIGSQGFESGEPYEQFIEDLGIDKWVEIGYSAGGSIAQWRTAFHPEKVEALWTFRSPGVPERVNEVFREAMDSMEENISLHISRARGDIIDYGGDCHLGKNAPENVRISFSQLYIPGIPHIGLGLGGGRYYGIEGGFTSQEINERLDNNARSTIEANRKFWGGKILTPILSGIRWVLRSLFDSRAEHQKGLCIEDHSEEHWQIRRIIAP